MGKRYRLSVQQMLCNVRTRPWRWSARDVPPEGVHPMREGWYLGCMNAGLGKEVPPMFITMPTACSNTKRFGMGVSTDKSSIYSQSYTNEYECLSGQPGNEGYNMSK